MLKELAQRSVVSKITTDGGIACLCYVGRLGSECRPATDLKILDGLACAFLGVDDTYDVVK